MMVTGEGVMDTGFGDWSILCTMWATRARQQRRERKGWREADNAGLETYWCEQAGTGSGAAGAHDFPRLWCPGVGVGVGGAGVGVGSGVGVGKGRIGAGVGAPTEAGEGTRASRTSPLIGGSVTTLPCI